MPVQITGSGIEGTSLTPSGEARVLSVTPGEIPGKPVKSLVFGLWTLTQTLSAVTVSAPVEGAGQISIVCISPADCAVGISDACAVPGELAVGFRTGLTRRHHLQAVCDGGALQLRAVNRVLKALRGGDSLELFVGDRTIVIEAKGAAKALDAQQRILGQPEYRRPRLEEL